MIFNQSWHQFSIWNYVKRKRSANNFYIFSCIWYNASCWIYSGNWELMRTNFIWSGFLLLVLLDQLNVLKITSFPASWFMYNENVLLMHDVLPYWDVPPGVENLKIHKHSWKYKILEKECNNTSWGIMSSRSQMFF